MKKGSLSLSVNAIVIFVLAFAMLGFGLFVINMLREQAEPAIEGAFNLADFTTPPTSQNPVVISEVLRLKPEDTKTVGIGVYNNQGGPMVNAKPAIGSCTGVPSLQIYLSVSAIKQTIPQSTTAGFTIILTTNKVDKAVAEAGTYICEFTVGGLSVQEEIIIQN